MSQTEAEPLLHSSSYGYASVTHDGHRDKLNHAGQAVSDLPSWTPLKLQEDEESLSPSDTEVMDMLTAGGETQVKSARTELPPTSAQETAESRGSSSSDARPFKRARFDGVFIATKPRPYRKLSAQARSGRAPAASNAHSFSLVDALTRTFDANRYPEDAFLRQSRPASRRKDGASTGLQTDVETTEAEDEGPRSNVRLARTHLKRRREGPGAGIAASTSVQVAKAHSEDAAVFPPQFERLAKRLRVIQYEANSALVDEALGTVQASIGWDAEMDIITRDDDFVIPAYAVHDAADVDGNRFAASSPGNACAPSSSRNTAESAWHMPTRGDSKQPVLSPYLSRRAKFRQRLNAAFGENATVRTDRFARPRLVDNEFLPDVDEHEGESVSESTASVSAVPSTRVTSRSPDTPPIADDDTNMMDRLRTGELNAIGASTGPTLGVSEEQMSGWIAALQRLIKGKVRAKEEDLEALSIVLAEIESVKESLNQRAPITMELRESVKQLSKLCEIPFGDRNKLHQRAENIFRALPPVRKLGAS